MARFVTAKVLREAERDQAAAAFGAAVAKALAPTPAEALAAAYNRAFPDPEPHDGQLGDFADAERRWRQMQAEREAKDARQAPMRARAAAVYEAALARRELETGAARHGPVPATIAAMLGERTAFFGIF